MAKYIRVVGITRKQRANILRYYRNLSVRVGVFGKEKNNFAKRNLRILEEIAE